MDSCHGSWIYVIVYIKMYNVSFHVHVIKIKIDTVWIQNLQLFTVHNNNYLCLIDSLYDLELVVWKDTFMQVE